MRRITTRALLVATASLASTVAFAQKAPVLTGATELYKVAPTTGFVDDAVALDDKRVAYVLADTAKKAELHVVTLADKADQVADISAVTLHPIRMWFVDKSVFVVGATDDGRETGALVTPGAKTLVTWKLAAPAHHITAVTLNAKPRIAVHRVTPSGKTTRHDVEIYDLAGKRLQSAALELDATNKSAKYDFKVNHWNAGFTQAVGIKTGAYDKKADARAPDVEATLDVLTGKVLSTAKIGDLFEHHRRYQALAEVGDRQEFMRLTWDTTGIQIWKDGKPRVLELDQAFSQYDPKSLQGIVAPDGSAWFLLKVDPTNADAVARKKADPEYTDLFKVGTDTKATRKVRVLAPGVRYRFGVGANDKLFLVERNAGFDRGGKTLSVVQAP